MKYTNAITNDVGPRKGQSLEQLAKLKPYFDKVNGTVTVKPITRQMLTTVTTLPAVDYTDLWWNANESGWGISLTQQFNIIFAAWFTYDSAGLPTWYVASNCTITNDACSGALYRVNGGSPLTVPWGGAGRVVTPVGNIDITFSSAGSATMRYTLDGVAGTKVLTRQPF